MKFVLAVLCFIFGSFFVGDCASELKKERYGAFGMSFMTSIIIIALMFVLIF